MPITVRYAQAIPDVKDGKDGKAGTSGKDGKKGVDGAAGTPGSGGTPKTVLTVDSDGSVAVDFDLSLYFELRVYASNNFDINVINGTDGDRFSIHIINQASTPGNATAPSFIQGATYPNGNTPPTWTTVYGFRDIVVGIYAIDRDTSVEHLWLHPFGTDYGVLA
jgi:hypothetical protein